MNKKLSPLLISILIPLAVGQLSALLTKNGLMTFEQIQKPAITPPSVVFPIVWTILYILMGISAYLISISDSSNKSTALNWYWIQLFFNFTWSLLFFNLGNYFISFLWLLLLILCICIMLVNFYKISPLAAYLQLPYLIWCMFAAYLNYQIFRLNP